MERWRAPTVLAWLEIALGMPQYGPKCADNVKSGKVSETSQEQKREVVIKYSSQTLGSYSLTCNVLLRVILQYFWIYVYLSKTINTIKFRQLILSFPILRTLTLSQVSFCMKTSLTVSPNQTIQVDSSISNIGRKLALEVEAFLLFLTSTGTSGAQ